MGAILSVIGIAFQLEAYRRVSIAAVQSVSGFGIIALLVVARLMLGERLSAREWSGACLALVALGLMIGSMVGASGATLASPMVARTEIAIVTTIALTVVVVLIALALNRSVGAVMGIGSGLLYGATGLAVKGASALIGRSGLGTAAIHLLTSPLPYTFVLTWIGALLLFQIGIQRTRLSVVAPLSTVVSIVLVIAVGTPLFDEGWPTAGLQQTLRVLGLVAILAALALSLTSEAATGDPQIAGSMADVHQAR